MVRENELESRRKEEVVAYFRAVVRHLSGVTQDYV
jgi:hypothetical protein